MRYLGFFVVLTAMFCYHATANAGSFCNNSYTVKGKIKVLNNAYEPDPYYEALGGIKVRIYNGVFHIKTTTTKYDGSFSKTWKSCSRKLNLKVGFVPTTKKINIALFDLPNYYKIKPSKTFKRAKPGSYNFGTFKYGYSESKNTHILKLFQSVKEILYWLKQSHDIDLIRNPGLASGHVEVGYPSLTPNDTSWYTPVTKHINLKERDFLPDTPLADTIAHEFGHLFQNAYGKWYLNLPNYEGNGGWSYNTFIGSETANMEGFATFFEYLFMTEHGFSRYGERLEDSLNKEALGSGGATNHAAFFYDLYDSDEDSDDDCHVDKCQIPLDEIMAVFAKNKEEDLNPFSIANHDMEDFIDRYYEIFGDAPAGCDLDELAYLNKLKQNPDGNNCEEPTLNFNPLNLNRFKRSVISL